jgi:hypothetical protein
MRREMQSQEKKAQLEKLRKVAGENGGNMWSAKINGVLQ